MKKIDIKDYAEHYLSTHSDLDKDTIDLFHDILEHADYRDVELVNRGVYDMEQVISEFLEQERTIYE
jgi:hypothetical protein